MNCPSNIYCFIVAPLLVIILGLANTCSAVVIEEKHYVDELPAEMCGHIESTWEYMNKYQILDKPSCATIIREEQVGSNFIFTVSFSETITTKDKPHIIKILEKQYGPDGKLVNEVNHEVRLRLFLFHFKEADENILVTRKGTYRTELKPSIDGKYEWEISIDNTQTSPRNITENTKSIILTAPSTGTPKGRFEKIEVTFTDIEGMQAKISQSLIVIEPKYTLPQDTNWLTLSHRYDVFNDTWLLLRRVEFIVKDQNDNTVVESGITVHESTTLHLNPQVRLLEGNINLGQASLVSGKFWDDFFAVMKSTEYDRIIKSGGGANLVLYTADRIARIRVSSKLYQVRDDAITVRFLDCRSVD